MNDYTKLEIAASRPATVILRFDTSWTGSTPPTEILVHGQSAEQSEALHQYLVDCFRQNLSSTDDQ